MDRRLNTIIDVILVFVLLEIVSMLLYSTLYVSYFKQVARFGGDVYTIILDLVWGAIILALLILKRKDLSRYGLTLHNLDSDVKVVAICILPVSVLVLINIVGLPDIGSLGITLLNALITVMILLVILKLLTYINGKEKKVAIGKPTLIIIPIVIILLIGGTMITGPMLVLLFIEFLFVGFVEELIFRGYIQSVLNEAFGRPYRFFGISWGAGLIIASLLFGFMHMLFAHFNPFLGWYGLDWQVGVVIFFGGLIFGFIREKTGNIVAPSILHSFIDFFSIVFMYL